MDDFNSRFGFRVEEDLGNGMKAIWQIENGLRMHGVPTSGSGTGTLGNRPTFVGLAGSFGKLRLYA